MNRKAIEMATGTIVGIVLGLIILVILVIFAQQQVSKGGKKFGQIGEEANYSVEKCQSIIKGTFCAKNCGPDYTAQSTAPTGDQWSDCKDKGMICCVPKEA